MRKNSLILIVSAFAALLALLLVAGCGSQESSQGYECDLNAPSLIPPPSGKPQYVYFYRDT